MAVSKKAAAIAPSVTLEISAKAKAMKASGKSIIAFTAGEPDFNTPAYIIESAKNALDKGYTKYTPTSGIPELKSAIVKKFSDENGLSYKENQIVVSCGAKSSLFHALYAVIDDGDEVIIPAPYWITYTEQVSLCGGKSVIVETVFSTGYKMTASMLENAVTEKTKCLIINSPCNPTGVVYSEKELNALAEVCEKRGLYVISDEIYEKLIFDGNRHYSIACASEYMKEHTVVINGVSKTYSMTGWRIGYMAAPLDVAKAVSNVQGHTTSNANSIAQYASVTALGGGKDFIDSMRTEFDERRKLLTGELDEIGELTYIKPEGAFYVFVNITKLIGKSFNGSKISGSVSFSDLLLGCGVAVIPGLAFGADDCIRLSYTVSKNDIKEGLTRIKSFISSLN